MTHFVSNLQYYIMFEVLESSWSEFEQEVKKAQDLGIPFLDLFVQTAHAYSH
jgi:hypothetical protein